MSLNKPWVDGPFRLISSSKSGDCKAKRVTGARAMAADMTVVHNLIIRGSNAIYLQCVNVGIKGSAKDKLDFANFAYRWCELIHEHHQSEESAFFPVIEELAESPGLMSGNIKEHAAFHQGMEEFSHYLEQVCNSRAEYNGENLKTLLDSFMPTLRMHLENEIESLVALEVWEPKVDWMAFYTKQVGAQAKEAIKQQRHRTEILPTAYVFHDKTFDGGIWETFPPIPWIASMILRFCFLSVNRDWWRFAGCDYNGMPKELPFA